MILKRYNDVATAAEKQLHDQVKKMVDLVKIIIICNSYEACVRVNAQCCHLVYRRGKFLSENSTIFLLLVLSAIWPRLVACHRHFVTVFQAVCLLYHLCAYTLFDTASWKYAQKPFQWLFLRFA